MSLSMGNRSLDDPNKIFIIAEMSGNHGQSYSQAERLVAAAAAAGASAIKCQTFVAEEICADVPILFGHDKMHDAWCRKMGVTKLRELFEKGGMPRHWHVPLKKFAESCGIEFLSTPFSVDAARFLVEEVGVRALKIASGDLTFAPLLAYAARTDLPVIMSTGGATLDEVAQAMTIFEQAQACPVLLHCLSVYPCDEAIVNLFAMKTLGECFGCPVGFSDHTLSYDIVPAVVAALGATVVEKHLTLDRSDGGVDSSHSLEPDKFGKMVDVLRQVPQMLGSGIKEPHALERHDRLWARRAPDDWLRPTQRARDGAWE